MGYRVIVQSERSAPYLESRIDSFLSSFKQKLADITDKEFQSHVKAVIIKKTEKLKNLGQESSRLWAYIGNEMYDFEQCRSFHLTQVASVESLTLNVVTADVGILKEFTKQDVIDFYNQHIDPDSRRRSKVSVQMQAAAASPEGRKPGLTEALVQFLSATAGVITEHVEVTKALEGVDINNTDAVVVAVSTFLKDVKKIEESMISTILGKGRAALAQAIPVKMDDEEQFKPEQFGRVFDSANEVVAWKASCRVTAGPRPVKPLVEFESTEVKL
jgi:insulysin